MITVPREFETARAGYPVLHGYARELLHALGEGFYYNAEESYEKQGPGYPDVLRSHAYLTNPKGLTLSLCFDSEYRPQRLHVTGQLPRYRDLRYYSLSSYQRENLVDSITVSLTKSFEQIAKDIKRRLLPDYEKLFDKATELIRNEEAYDDDHAALVRMAARITGEKVTEHELQRTGRPYFRLIPKGNYFDQVQVEGKTLKVQFEISSGDMADQLEKVVEFVRNLKNPKKPTEAEVNERLHEAIFGKVESDA